MMAEYLSIPIEIRGSITSLFYQSEEGTKTLHQYVREGDVDGLRFRLKKLKNSINSWDENKMAPLHYAAKYNNVEVVRTLLEHGADVHVTGDEGQTALHFAAKYKILKVHHKPAKRIFYNADMESQEDEHDIAAQLDGMLQILTNGSIVQPCASVINVLIEHGGNINCRDSYQSTPLHLAAMRCTDATLKTLLLCEGIDLEARDIQLMTPFHVATIYKNIACVKTLMDKGVNIMAVDSNKQMPLHIAAAEGSVEILELLFEALENRPGLSIEQVINIGDNKGNAPLHLAVEHGCHDAVKLLVIEGAAVNQRRDNLDTPLHLASKLGSLTILETLVENQVDIEPLNKHHATPLHIAALYNRYHAIEYLRNQGADLDVVDEDNFTALLIAAHYGHVESIKILIKLGANLFITDKKDRTPVHLACNGDKVEVLQVGQVLQLLLDYTSSKQIVRLSDCYGYEPLHVAAEAGSSRCIDVLLKAGAHACSKTDDCQTALHLAAKNGKLDFVEKLLKVKVVSVNAHDELGNTPLHLAASEGHENVTVLLLQNGADVSARNTNQFSPIECAAACGKLQVVKLLLENNSPIDPIDKNNMTPLLLASKAGCADIVKLLIARGANTQATDIHGYNCVDLAVNNGHREVVLAIIHSNKWLEAMKHAYTDRATKLQVTPLRRLIVAMPDLAEQVLQKCIKSTKAENEDNITTSVIYNYELLDDQYAKWQHDEQATNFGDVGCSHRVKESTKPYTANRTTIKNNHPLHIMVKAKQEKLLVHPLVKSLLDHKWRTIGRYVYYCSLVTYLLFVVFLTGIALLLTPPHQMVIGVNASVLSNASHNDCADVNLAELSEFVRVFFLDIGVPILFTIIIIKLLSEAIQVCNARLSYFNWENMLELTLYIAAVLFLDPFTTSCQYFREIWQWDVGVLTIFLAWIKLILIIRKLPRFGIYIVMFTQILRTFMKFIIIIFLFITGFAISFYMALSTQQPFQGVRDSLAKTTVMMIGEFEFDSIFNDRVNSALHYPHSAYIIFIIFIVVMPIIVMNLLIGLAVGDIKDIKDQATLTRKAMQVELVLSAESVLFEKLTKRFMLTYKKVTYTDDMNTNHDSFISLCKLRSSTTIKRAHSLPPIAPTDQDLITGKSELRNELEDIKSNIRQMQENVHKMMLHKVGHINQETRNENL